MVHDTFINVRKLAAVDIVFHGYRLILVEFGLGVFLLALFGLWVAGRSLLLGLYIMFLGLNYVPLVVYAIAITRKKSAQKEAATELLKNDTKRKYGIQQALLLIPLAIPILALTQEMKTRSLDALGIEQVDESG